MRVYDSRRLPVLGSRIAIPSVGRSLGPNGRNGKVEYPQTKSQSPLLASTSGDHVTDTHAHRTHFCKQVRRERNVRAPRRPLCKCSFVRSARLRCREPCAPLLLLYIFVNAAAAAAATRFTSSESPERSTRWLGTKLPLPAPTITTPRGMRTKPRLVYMRCAKLNLINPMPIHRPHEIAIFAFAFTELIKEYGTHGFT